MSSLTADQKADLALVASVVVPVAIAILQTVANRLKPLAKSERFKNNVITRVEAGSFGRPETHYIVNPAFIRSRKDGALEVPGVGRAGMRHEDLKNLRSSGMWLDMIDASGVNDSELYIVAIGRVPKP